MCAGQPESKAAIPGRGDNLHRCELLSQKRVTYKPSEQVQLRRSQAEERQTVQGLVAPGGCGVNPGWTVKSQKGHRGSAGMQ